MEHPCLFSYQRQDRHQKFTNFTQLAFKVAAYNRINGHLGIRSAASTSSEIKYPLLNFIKG